jgi:peptidoglycan/LPS O-acetylase OafA/YrhL
MRHRAEIDGLRAIAVLPVIFFHAGFSAFHGGFIGVDVFFVISGFLITSLIQEDRQQGRFSIADFYERRARRILPALFFVMLCCLAAAWWVMNASDFINFGQSLAAVAVFSSGLLYAFSAGYFDTSSELKPLLHTWSLGVEEQFYLFFPLILMLLSRLGGKPLRIGVLALAIASLGLAQWGMSTYPTSTFFFMPTRAWELLIGALLALSQARLQDAPLRVCQAMSGLGMGLLLMAALWFDKNTPFPSVYTLVPTLGAALVIGFGHSRTWVGTVLSTPALVGVGLISYSAYLWHQPLFAFTRLLHGGEPSPAVMFSLALLTLVLAYATWRWVETPLRSRQRLSRGGVFALSGAFTAGFVGIGAASHFHVLTTRWEQHNPTLVNYTAAATDQAHRQGCRQLLQGLGMGDCLQFGEGRRTMVIWGDSHAKALQAGTPHLPDTRILVITHSGCPPLPGLRRIDKTDGANVCNDFDVLDHFARLIESLHPDTVVLASRWTLYLRGWVYEGRSMKEGFALSDGQDQQALASQTYRQDMFRHHLQAVIDRLAVHSQVLILTQPMDLAQRTFRSVEFSDLRVSRAEVDSWHAPERAVFSQLQLPPHAQILDLKQLFCDAQACATRLKGTLLYKDDNHLSALGANMVWQALGEQAFKPVGSVAAGSDSSSR